MEFNGNWAIKLTAIMGIIFILQVMFPFVTETFILDSKTVLLKPWTIVTSIFLHADLSHILLNGLALFLFGSILENIIGSKKFLTYFFLTGIIASLAFIFSIPLMQSFFGESATAALGASGAIFGVLGILTVLRPNMIVYLGFFPMPMWMAAIVWAAQDFLGIFIPDNIGNFAHLGGLFAGLIIGFLMNNGKMNIERKTQSPKVVSDQEIENWEKGWK